MRQCFEERDIGMLQKVILELPKEEAEYHIKRCIDSGLWIPNAADLEKEEGSKDEASGGVDAVEKEEEYEQVD